MFRRLFAQPIGPRRRLIRALKSPNPNQRRRAINVVGSLQEPALYPQAVKLLEYIAQNDPLPGLRKLAQSYLEQMRPRLGAHPGNSAAAARNVEWNCAFCGTNHLTANACPNCAAPRP